MAHYTKCFKTREIFSYHRKIDSCQNKQIVPDYNLNTLKWQNLYAISKKEDYCIIFWLCKYVSSEIHEMEVVIEILMTSLWVQFKYVEKKVKIKSFWGYHFYLEGEDIIPRNS